MKIIKYEDQFELYHWYIDNDEEMKHNYSILELIFYNNKIWLKLFLN